MTSELHRRADSMLIAGVLMVAAAIAGFILGWMFP